MFQGSSNCAFSLYRAWFLWVSIICSSLVHHFCKCQRIFAKVHARKQTLADFRQIVHHCSKKDSIVTSIFFWQNLTYFDGWEWRWDCNILLTVCCISVSRFYDRLWLSRNDTGRIHFLCITFQIFVTLIFV